MLAAGIITEYDPFHAGHAWQIEQAKALGAQAVAVCMSTDVTQRGGLALLPPWVRAKAALQAGADLVLGLPAPCALQSAEGFAAAGVAALTALPGLSWLVFGAESPEVQALKQTAALLDEPEFQQELSRQLATGISFAAARAKAAARLLPLAGQVLASPNNNLGVEYCKAIRRSKSHLEPVPLPRKGAAHGQLTPGQEGFASATFLRQAWAREGAQGLQGYVPDQALELYRQAQQQGLDISGFRFELAVLSRLRAASVEQLAQVRDTAEGLEHRLAQAVSRATSLEELYSLLKTKRYAHARLRRYVLCAALGYTGQTSGMPSYLHILGTTPQGLELLRGAALPADTSLARLARLGQAQPGQVQAHAAAADLAALCRSQPGPMGQCYTQPPCFVGKRKQ